MASIPTYMDIPGIHIAGALAKKPGQSLFDFDDLGFVYEVRRALKTLQAKDNGRKLLAEISEMLLAKKRNILIEEALATDGREGPGWIEEEYVLRWTVRVRQPRPNNFDQLNGVPDFIILGHELIHAHHSLLGSTKYTLSEDPTDTKINVNDNAIEEARTIGIGPWAGEDLTEDGLRREWNIPLRSTHTGANADKLLKGSRYACRYQAK